MEYKIELSYVEGLNLLFNNPCIILSLPNKEDYNGYSKIYIDKDTQELEESYYVYDDCGGDDGVKATCHKVNLKNKFLYINGYSKENVLLYIKYRWGIDLNWSMILAMLEYKPEGQDEKAIINYLADIYYGAIKDMTANDFDIDTIYADKIHDLLEDLALDLH